LDSDDLVRQWKQPGARQGHAAEHPSGEIVLRADGGLGRRAALLAAQESLRLSTTHIPTTNPTSTMTHL
jgi:hypothetical protein